METDKAFEFIIGELENNKAVFEGLLNDLSREIYLFRPPVNHETEEPGDTIPVKWNILEIVCHLYDEEREDFRSRIKHVLEYPRIPLTPIDPQGWVKDRKYMERNFNTVCTAFFKERVKSVEWLRSLRYASWNNVYMHPTLGNLTPWQLLHAWLAHDYLHIRQITFNKYNYLRSFSVNLGYAGSW
jgi:hypothetical protein